MALRVVQHLSFSSFIPDTPILSGQIVAVYSRPDGTIAVRPANRLRDNANSIVGIAGDDAQSSSVIIDPVSLTYTSTPRRRLGDYLDDGLIGFDTSRRLISVFSLGGEFASDQYCPHHFAIDDTTDGYTFGEVDYPTGSFLTVATDLNNNVGKLIANPNGCYRVGQVLDKNNGLLHFRLLDAPAVANTPDINSVRNTCNICQQEVSTVVASRCNNCDVTRAICPACSETFVCNCHQEIHDMNDILDDCHEKANKRNSKSYINEKHEETTPHRDVLQSDKNGDVAFEL